MKSQSVLMRMEKSKFCSPLNILDSLDVKKLQKK